MNILKVTKPLAVAGKVVRKGIGKALGKTAAKLLRAAT